MLSVSTTIQESFVPIGYREYSVDYKTNLNTITLRESTIIHLDLPSTCLHQDSPEGLEQLEKEKILGMKRLNNLF